ncbi:MAG TPA: hypothetical protein PKD58_10300 [Candidatus Sumerlaeota bacterium]|nr:hypothetical protein [Candidatus Sumerlaeota bacterium]HMX63446.1 hypothetical protein [Candidatus Sumerlaeota bacterium]HNM47157.1 hypothetical protein [Candidatus Sumerlaeota bacterium]
MFLKLTDNELGTDVYLNPDHIIRFVANPEGTGTLIFMSHDAAVAPPGEAQVVTVHEPAEEVFRIISRLEKGPGKVGGPRGFV